MDQPLAPLAQSYPDEVRRPVSALAVASFVCSLLGFPGGVVGAVLGVMALLRMDRQGQRGKAFAWAGIALAVLWLVLLVGMVIAYESVSGSVVTGHL
jgi:hypothetical protein